MGAGLSAERPPLKRNAKPLYDRATDERNIALRQRFNKMCTLKEIQQNWKLEAKQEDSLRYFFHVQEASEIVNGDKFYIIGRKGSGKSAISQYLLNLNKVHAYSGYNIFTEQLTFKNFPFNELYALENKSYTRPNQYITIWKYIIYSCVCRQMVKNQNIDSELRKVLEQLYPPMDIKSLSRMIGSWTMNGFGGQVMGSGLDFKIERMSEFKNLSWIEKTNILEDIIDKYIDDAHYFVIFDELDEDYGYFNTKEDREQYLFLITSLFKAVQDVKSYFKDRKQVVCPVVFLRDDIYLLIKDTDKNKWGDFKISLEWDTAKLKSMLAFRISKAIDADGKVLTFDDAWHHIFTDETMKLGANPKKRIPIFDYITLSTQLRPRDYIKYLQVCAERALQNGESKITGPTVKFVDKGFSNYLKDEMFDEVHAQLPDIQVIFSIISQIRKWAFTIDEFKKTYLSYYKKGTVSNGNVDHVLQLLFDFSIIGNMPKKRQIYYFRYTNPEARFNFKENIVVHRGLFKALQIL